MMSSVSVVIPVLNAARTLPLCLAALTSLDPEPTETLLVDNGSTDGSLGILLDFARAHEERHVQVLQEVRPGAAAARNAGIRAARSETIAFTDADCAPATLWLRRLTEAFSDKQVGAVAGRVLPSPAASTLEAFSGLYTLQSPRQFARHTHWTPWEGGFPTANFAVRAALVRNLGGFDESVETYGEDYDLCARVYAQGLEIAYTPEAEVLHYHRTTLRGMVRQAFNFGRSHPYLLRRHAHSGIWLDLPGRSICWEGAPLRAWVDLAAADKKLLAFLVAGLLTPKALVLLLAYISYLCWDVSRRIHQRSIHVPPWTYPAMAGCLLAKSGAMTAGRWWGSVKYGAVCI